MEKLDMYGLPASPPKKKKAVTPTMLEAELLRFATDVLEWSGLVFWRVSNAPSLFNKGSKVCFRPSPIRGFPDLAGLTADGTFWAMELKTVKGKVESHQKEWHDKLRASNAFVTVARTKEEIVTFVESMGGKIRASAKSKSPDRI